MWPLLDALARCPRASLTRASALIAPPSVGRGRDATLPAEHAPGAFAIAVSLLRASGYPLRDECLVDRRRFDRLERVVLRLPVASRQEGES